MPRLNPGDSFPKLTLSTTDGQLTTVPDAFARDFGVVLYYPGAWCPYCSPQLGAKHEPALPVGHGAITPAVAAHTGAFVNPDRVYPQSTGFGPVDRHGQARRQHPQILGLDLSALDGELPHACNPGRDTPAHASPAPLSGDVA
jgi:Redoxin